MSHTVDGEAADELLDRLLSLAEDLALYADTNPRHGYDCDDGDCAGKAWEMIQDWGALADRLVGPYRDPLTTE